MSFSELLGNKAAKTALQRLIECKAVPYALLFCGPDGVGKSLCALHMVQSLMGSSSQAKLLSGNHPDLHRLRPEGKGGVHPIESIRALISEAALPPFEAPAKFFIIHDAHQMLPASGNALLKTLEEPAEHTYFILLTSQPESLLPTIVSRLRKVAFFPIADKEIAQYAQEHWHKEKKEAERIAFLSHGSFDKASHLANSAGDTHHALVQEFVSLSLPSDYPRLFSICEAWEKSLEEETLTTDALLEEILAWYRDLLLVKEKIAPECLFHLDAIQQLQEKAKGTVVSLETILSKIITVRSALQRHVKLRTALEHFFT
ncbi:MAG TPA: DNA polymerase III subunit [Rhabdochlamydiaceae bacterium]|jgi:DNA polymerase-3 subunit delta'